MRNIHLMLGKAVADAARKGLVVRNVAFTMSVYQHVLPGMQAEAVETFAELLARRRI